MIDWTDDPSKFDMHDLWFAEGVKAGRAEAFEENLAEQLINAVAKITAIVRTSARAEAFEEAARMVDDLIENDPLLLPRVAAAIRALAKAGSPEQKD